MYVNAICFVEFFLSSEVIRNASAFLYALLISYPV